MIFIVNSAKLNKISKKLKKIKNYLQELKSNFYNLLFNIPFIQKPLPSLPFSRKPIGDEKTYIKLHKKTISENCLGVEEFEKEYGYTIDLNWFSELSLATQTCIKKSKLNFNHGRLIYSTLSKYLSINKENSDPFFFILETGTARGFSSICMSKALNDQQAKGIITTIDCISHNQKIYWNAISDSKGAITRSELLKPWESELKNILFIQGWTNEIINRLGIKRINFAFLDAQHNENAVLEEYYFVSERQIPGDIIFFDDVTPNYFDGVCSAVKRIVKNGDYKIKYYNFDKLRGYAIATKI